MTKAEEVEREWKARVFRGRGLSGPQEVPGQAPPTGGNVDMVALFDRRPPATPPKRDPDTELTFDPDEDARAARREFWK